MEDNKQITITFPDGKVAKQIVNLVVKKRPSGWSRRSYATYYKLVYAEWLLKDIDAMIADRKRRVYRYADFPKISPSSLYLRINQALMYILDSENGLDPDYKYAKFRQQVSIKRIAREGIVLEFDEIFEIERGADICVGSHDTPKWKKKMDEYLEGDDINPFHQQGLVLTEDEIAQIELELSGLENILYSVSSKEIKIIKS